MPSKKKSAVRATGGRRKTAGSAKKTVRKAAPKKAVAKEKTKAAAKKPAARRTAGTKAASGKAKLKKTLDAAVKKARAAVKKATASAKKASSTARKTVKKKVAAKKAARKKKVARAKAAAKKTVKKTAPKNAAAKKKVTARKKAAPKKKATARKRAAPKKQVAAKKKVAARKKAIRKTTRRTPGTVVPPGAVPGLSEEDQIRAAKYLPRDLPKRLFEEDRFLFPESYGVNRVRLLVRDPEWIFSYWDVSAETMKGLAGSLGERTLALSRLTLRVLDPVSGGVSDILLPPGARWWYIRADATRRTYRAEIGITLPSGEFRQLAESNSVVTPRVGPSRQRAGRHLSYHGAGEVPSREAAAAGIAEREADLASEPWSRESTDAAASGDKGGASETFRPARPKGDRPGASDAFRPEATNRPGSSDTRRR